ncbi:hypothetical protein O181_019546 [Austropuccinia psidii MF-1]|uniref:Reverse transcriptase domain-containing protein n=1 Tax=Austropuccinia psidii MF-1 TaxID=1389203 RepID=A0A9Q3GTY8_9BASI|nr:hypothetical protein [Austropuccinia psidii MF-1]
MGMYEYTRMPFGIKNASAHFQKMIDTVFQEEILEGWMVVYIDDISIYSETWEHHKCNFGQKKLLVLGHKVSGLILAIDQNKVAAVLQKPVPNNIKEIQSFLGLTSYYRNHIKNFAHITSNLYKLWSKDIVFEITKERRDAYERIKDELTHEPVLIVPDFELPFKLYIDAACSQCLGAALHQRQIVEGELREGVICYISRKLKDSESRLHSLHQGKCCINSWRLTSRQEHVKRDKIQADFKQKSTKCQAHITLWSYTKSCDIHQYCFLSAFNSDASPPDHPATFQRLAKGSQDPPVSTHTHQRGPSASLNVEKGCLISQFIHEKTLP